MAKFNIEVQRYVPYIDDGVLLNMSPLWELISSLKKELQKTWEVLEQGDYDWAFQAMDHWLERVKEKCNKSNAITHGLG